MATANSPFTIEVGDTAEKISNAGTRTTARLFRNLGATSVYLGGDDTVTDSGATMGWELEAGADFTDSVSNGDIYAISASGNTNDVQVWEVK